MLRLMTEPNRSREDQLRQVLAELILEGDIITTEILTRAGVQLEERRRKHHHAMHADVQREGAVLWGMRERGMSWYEIRVALGITQRTAQRQIDLFLEEGIAPRPENELDARLEGG
jgi:hypothetical protein